MQKTAQKRVLQILTSAALAITYIAIGFAICAGFPQITRNLSSDNSAFSLSPYDHDDLIELALTTRDYTVDDFGREAFGEAGAQASLAQEVLDRAKSSADPTSPTADRWSDEARAILDEDAAHDPSPDVTMEKLAAADEQYALTTAALEHLDEVNQVISSVRMPLFGCTLIAAFCLMALVFMFGAKPAGQALIASGCLCLSAFALLGIWALVSFDALFAWLHGLFFADETWTFPADSLLIQMYPEGFWVGMGMWWLGASCVVAVASIVIGATIVWRGRMQDEKPRPPAGLQA